MVINSVQFELSQRKDRDLWRDAIEGPTTILLAPEQLEGNGFSKLVDNEKFRELHEMRTKLEAANLKKKQGAELQRRIKYIDESENKKNFANGHYLHMI